MTNKSRLLCLSIAFAAGVFAVLSIDSVETASPTVAAASVPIPTPTVGGTNELKVEASNGLRIVTFDATSGRVLLHLPDDMRAGDTISGTVTAEPKGQTPEERAKNLETLNGYTITLWPNPPPAKPGEGILRLPVKDPTFTFPLTPGTFNPEMGFPGFNATLGPPIAAGTGGTFGAADVFPGIGSVVGGILPGVVLATTTAPPSSSFVVPPLGQQGRPLEITGPFDGNSSNTALRFTHFPSGTGMGEPVADQFSLMAESPRKAVFRSPNNVTGPIEVNLKERAVETKGTIRVVGIGLSAPKTNLTRGEKTTLTVEVRGLEGLKTDVPLQLDSKGVITMEGGSFQNLRIKPSEVTPDGRYTTNRAITGVRAGGFSVNGTVIVRPYDLCLQDDSDPNRLFYWNSFTGDYVFACGGGSCRPGPTVPPTNVAPPVNVIGTGKPAMKGCIITLSHNAPDRRVFARLDACTKAGDASVETKSPKTNFNITDKNTADNTAPSCAEIVRWSR